MTVAAPFDFTPIGAPLRTGPYRVLTAACAAVRPDMSDDDLRSSTRDTLRRNDDWDAATKAIAGGRGTFAPYCRMAHYLEPYTSGVTAICQDLPEEVVDDLSFVMLPLIAACLWGQQTPTDAADLPDDFRRTLDIVLERSGPRRGCSCVEELWAAATPTVHDTLERVLVLDTIISLLAEGNESLDVAAVRNTSISAMLEDLAPATSDEDKRDSASDASLARRLELAQAEIERLTEELARRDGELQGAKGRLDEHRARADQERERAALLQAALDAREVEMRSAEEAHERAIAQVRSGQVKTLRVAGRPLRTASGRTVYACRLTGRAEDAEDAIERCAEWAAGGDDDLTASLLVGDGISLPRPDLLVASAQATRQEDGDRLLWECALRHPHERDPEVTVISTISVAREADWLEVSTQIRFVRFDGRLCRAFLEVRMPDVIRALLREGQMRDAGELLQAGTQRVDDDLAVGRLAHLVADPRRTHPVLLMSPDVADIEHEARGLAHLRTVDSAFCDQVAARLGVYPQPSRWAAVLWPADGDRVGKPYFVSGPSAESVAGRIRRLLHEVAATALADSEDLLRLRSHFDELRRDVVRTQFEQELMEAERGAGRDAEVMEMVWEENDRLDAELARVRADLARATAEVNALRARGHGRVDAEVPVPEALSPHAQFELRRAAVDRTPTSVLDALEIASGASENLVFAESARDDARRCDFAQPQRMLEDLLKLGVIADLYARSEALGRPLAMIARDLGLDWAEGASAARRGNTARFYQFHHEGQRYVMEPHLRVGGSRSGRTRIGRVYFAVDEDERRILVGGMLKRPDTTTG